MKNNGLGSHNEKMSAEISTGNNPNTPQLIRLIRQLFGFKFIYFEKAIFFCEISNLDLFYVVTVKSTVEISQNFVAFSEYINFILESKRLHHKSIVHALDKTFAVRKFVAFRQKCQAFSEHLEDMTSII